MTVPKALNTAVSTESTAEMMQAEIIRANTAANEQTLE